MTRPVGRHLTEAERVRLRAALRQPGAVPTQVARAFGVSRCIAAAEARKLREAGEAPEIPAGLSASPLDRKIIGLEDENRRLRTELRALHRESLDAAAVRAILGGIAEAPPAPPDWLLPPAAAPSGNTPEVPVTIWSDWHFGEVVSRAETDGINAFDPSIAEARVRYLVDKTIRLCRFYGPKRYPGIVVNLLGDNVSGGLHPELQKTDAEEVIPATLRCRDLLVWALDQMIAEFGRVFVPCASGNHGRNTPKPEFKRYVFKSFDWLIYELLARHFAGREEITFLNPASNEVHYRVLGQRFLAMHGDMLGVKGGDGIIGALGPIARGEVKVGKQAASLGRDYDVLLMGHWHQALWLPRVIVANSLKGFDEYAKNALRAPPSEPSQPLFFVHPRRGITSRWDVKVEAPREAAPTEWVSWQEVA